MAGLSGRRLSAAGVLLYRDSFHIRSFLTTQPAELLSFYPGANTRLDLAGWRDRQYVFQSPSHRGVARDANSRKTTCRLRRFQSPSHRGVARDVGGFSLWKRSTNGFSPLHIGESRATCISIDSPLPANGVSVPFTSGSRARQASDDARVSTFMRFSPLHIGESRATGADPHAALIVAGFQSPSHRGVARDYLRSGVER